MELLTFQESWQSISHMAKWYPLTSYRRTNYVHYRDYIARFYYAISKLERLCKKDPPPARKASNRDRPDLLDITPLFSSNFLRIRQDDDY